MWCTRQSRLGGAKIKDGLCGHTINNTIHFSGDALLHSKKSLLHHGLFNGWMNPLALLTKGLLATDAVCHPIMETIEKLDHGLGERPTLTPTQQCSLHNGLIKHFRNLCWVVFIHKNVWHDGPLLAHLCQILVDGWPVIIRMDEMVTQVLELGDRLNWEHQQWWTPGTEPLLPLQLLQIVNAEPGHVNTMQCWCVLSVLPLGSQMNHTARRMAAALLWWWWDHQVGANAWNGSEVLIKCMASKDSPVPGKPLVGHEGESWHGTQLLVAVEEAAPRLVPLHVPLACVVPVMMLPGFCHTRGTAPVDAWACWVMGLFPPTCVDAMRKGGACKCFLGNRSWI